ncbi:hypothetical protein BCE_4588 [Bacillus cereus ATCC 10987]|uniref:Uncharacterized protein n=1 Tax=Bacillus cereus (strain ATCC 10987 / NRS 248) TaxID=222523 RepID=Q72ZS9_BACC1|nr:hypothetical protein BCE_4588 [Bacillus cereus ATCC 10987]
MYYYVYELFHVLEQAVLPINKKTPDFSGVHLYEFYYYSFSK